jgi:hypothetical protein
MTVMRALTSRSYCVASCRRFNPARSVMGSRRGEVLVVLMSMLALQSGNSQWIHHVAVQLGIL